MKKKKQKPVKEKVLYPGKRPEEVIKEKEPLSIEEQEKQDIIPEEDIYAMPFEEEPAPGEGP